MVVDPAGPEGVRWGGIQYADLHAGPVEGREATEEGRIGEHGTSLPVSDAAGGGELPPRRPV